MDPGDVRRRVCQACLARVAEVGLAKLTVADVADRAGVGRATLYRHFPGGRDELLRATVEYEELRVLARLAESLAGAVDLGELFRRGLRFARRAVEGHPVLQTLLRTEPELLAPLFTTSAGRVRGLVADFLRPHLARHGVPDRWLGDTADELARFVMSFMTAPGSWDVEDDGELAELVERHVLAPLRARGSGRPGGEVLS
jgi:AcrR family transcriptional regulator